MLPAFDEDQRELELRTLSPEAQVAFGAACASRILPNYAAFVAEVSWGRIDPMQLALQRLFRLSTGAESLSNADIAILIDDCESQVPNSEDFQSPNTTSAQDAVFAVCSLLDFVHQRDIKKLVNAVRYPTDSIDLYVQETAQMDAQDPKLESMILAHPLMQQELMRQQRDIDELRRGTRDSIDRVLQRAETEVTFALAT